jgi:hypothetical protein
VVALPLSDAISGIEVPAVTICPSGGSHVRWAFVLAPWRQFQGCWRAATGQIDSTELVGRRKPHHRWDEPLSWRSANVDGCRPD